MGAVFKAEDTTLRRLVALKALSSHLAENEEAMSRIERLEEIHGYPAFDEHIKPKG